MVCKNCRASFRTKERGRRAIFCSGACRFAHHERLKRELRRTDWHSPARDRRSGADLLLGKPGGPMIAASQSVQERLAQRLVFNRGNFSMMPKAKKCPPAGTFKSSANGGSIRRASHRPEAPVRQYFCQPSLNPFAAPCSSACRQLRLKASNA